MREIKIGILGFGTVGTGLIKILFQNQTSIEEKLGARIVIKKIADIDIKRDRGINIPQEILTTDCMEVIDDPEIDIVVELIGGYEPARTYIIESISRGKNVVTANKALLATKGLEIFNLAYKKGVDIGFEGSVGGGIPIIRAVKEGLVANNILSIYGIINGTANYILSKMAHEGGKFKDVLRKAQEKGYAEADPTLDVEGIDSAHKLAILVSLCFGTKIFLEDIYTEGISHISPLDIKFAKEFGYSIKLLAIAKTEGNSISARVHPTMLPQNHPLSAVDGVFNAIAIHGDAVGPTIFYGRGAGMMPTGSAVMSDIIDISRNIIHKSQQRLPPLGYQWNRIKDIKIKPIEELEVRYYLRFSVIDRPGVLSKISGILGDNNISIASVIQKGRQIEGAVPVVMITHEAKERNIRKALELINNLPVVLEKTILIRIEDRNL